MSISSIGNAIKDSLRENLIDPVGRPNAQWIHYKRVPAVPSDIGKTPCVYIEPIPSTGGFGIIGTARDYRYVRFWVTIVGSIGDRGMVDGHPVTSPEELINHVAEKIYDYLTTNATSITTVGQPLEGSTNMIAVINFIDGVGGIYDLTPNKMAVKLIAEVLENR